MAAVFKDFGVLDKNSLTDQLYHLSFDTAAKMIEKMEDNTRQIVLKEIDSIKLKLNEQMCLIDEYTMEDGYPRPLCSMGEYYFISSMVKRLDILVSMLCDVNDAIAEQDAYNEYEEWVKLQNMRPEERAEYVQLMQYEGKTILNRESIDRDMAATAGSTERMKKLASTDGAYDDDLMKQAAALTKSYFYKKNMMSREVI